MMLHMTRQHGTLPPNLAEGSLLTACIAVLQRNAQNIQARLVNPHRTPAQQAADVVERVIVTGGEDYLETQQHTLWWWQLALLDVKLFLGLCILAVLGIVIMILYAVFTGARLLLRSVSGRKLQRATSWKRKAL